MQRRIEQVDALTGEVIEGASLVLVTPKRKNAFQQDGWIAMSQRALMEMARSGLGQEATRVALALLSLVDYENYLSVSQAELGRVLGLRPQNVNRAFARLLAEGFLLPGPKLAGRGTYALNPAYGWKGSSKGHHAAMAARIKASGLAVVQGGAGTPSDPV